MRRLTAIALHGPGLLMGAAGYATARAQLALALRPSLIPRRFQRPTPQDEIPTTSLIIFISTSIAWLTMDILYEPRLPASETLGQTVLGLKEE